MKVEGISSSGPQLILNRPVIGAGGSVEGKAQKTLGEAAPIQLSLSEIGNLASMFAPSGLVRRLQRRLNHLKKRKCRVVPAKGGNACVDDEDVVYLGIKLLEDFKDEPETLAGIMAHEWGHACALKPKKGKLQKLSWNQIFELRRAHETLADEVSGRLLLMMGLKPDGLIQFLTKGRETHTLKYHAPEIRAQVIQYGYQAEKRKRDLARSLFSKDSYKNEYDTILLDIA